MDAPAGVFYILSVPLYKPVDLSFPLKAQTLFKNKIIIIKTCLYYSDLERYWM